MSSRTDPSTGSPSASAAEATGLERLTRNLVSRAGQNAAYVRVGGQLFAIRQLVISGSLGANVDSASRPSTDTNNSLN